MVDADKFLSRHDGVRRLGEGRYVMLCRAHDDHSPSLHATVAGDKLLINYKAGCSAQDVLDAVGLTFADLYSDASRAAYAAATANGGKRFHRRYQVDPLAEERRILQIARSQIRHGKPLSLEDRARAELAIERLRDG